MLVPINEELINIIHYYVVTKLVADEGIIYSGTITGCVDKVFMTLYGQKRYERIEDRAGSLLYSIVHGHSFTDGNKRTGLLTACIFLYFNGKLLKLPRDCTQFLERMADAKNPNAPTEADAITWIRKNSASDLSAFFMNTILAVYNKAQMLGFLPELTKIILSQDILPNIDQKALIDRKLLETRLKRWENRACNGNSKNGQKT